MTGKSIEGYCNCGNKLVVGDVSQETYKWKKIASIPSSGAGFDPTDKQQYHDLIIGKKLGNKKERPYDFHSKGFGDG